jgi:protein farnesyltransferase/geranylgeranyltransferase type-1 subunit alpha
MTEYIPLSQRQDWADVVPIEQYEGGVAPIAPIPYPPAYVELMGYFRAILKS